MDHKELIRRLDNCGEFDGDLLDAAAEAIETLLAERDAMKSDLLALRTCSTCANSEENSGRGKPCAFGPVCTGQYWKWRGPQKEPTP